MICLMLVNNGRFLARNTKELQLVTDVIMCIALALTVISLVDYLVKNKGVMKEQK